MYLSDDDSSNHQWINLRNILLIETFNDFKINSKINVIHYAHQYSNIHSIIPYEYLLQCVKVNNSLNSRSYQWDVTSEQVKSINLKTDRTPITYKYIQSNRVLYLRQKLIQTNPTCFTQIRPSLLLLEDQWGNGQWGNNQWGNDQTQKQTSNSYKVGNNYWGKFRRKSQWRNKTGPDQWTILILSWPWMYVLDTMEC